MKREPSPTIISVAQSLVSRRRRLIEGTSIDRKEQCSPLTGLPEFFCRPARRVTPHARSRTAMACGHYIQNDPGHFSLLHFL